MKKDLWRACLDCNEKCCGDFAFPLFLTPEEREKHPNLNKKCPCVFFGRGGGYVKFIAQGQLIAGYFLST